MRKIGSEGASSVVFAIVVVICIVGSTVGTYLFMKNDLDAVHADSVEVKSMYDNLIEEIEDDEDNRAKFDRAMFKGLRKNVDGDYSYGYANCDFENARINYDANYLDVAATYYDSSDTVYAAANNYYKEAEAFFNSAITFAPNDNMKNLATYLRDESKYGAQVAEALHQNCEYMSSASNAYFNGNYDVGDSALETANTFIDLHDSLIPPFENASTNVNALIDSL